MKNKINKKQLKFNFAENRQIRAFLFKGMKKFFYWPKSNRLLLKFLE